jgi:MYXO-CTERM domain-containing protein
MAQTRRQALLVFILPLAVAIGVTSLIDSRYATAGSAPEAPAAATYEPDETAGPVDAERLLADSAAPAPLDPVLPPRSLPVEALEDGRSRGEAAEHPLPIPEPDSGLLLVLGLVGLAVWRRALPRA